MGAAYFRRAGFDVVHAAAADLRGGQPDTHPGQIYAWARAHVPDTAEAVFVAGNGFRAVGVVDVLEEDLGRPVLTANQVLVWNALAIAGVEAKVDRCGRIFEERAP